MIPTRPFRRRTTFLAALLGLFLLYHFLTIRTELQPPHERRRADCPPLPGMDDVLVVLKTGVTEAMDKIPIHFQTTLRCVPHYVVFSDFEEEIGGIRVYDALQNMDPEVKRTVPDFDIYNRLQRQGRAGLATDDFADEANSAIGKPNNPGWKLDKWKFLPMVQESLKYKPDAKWFVFMEADTYFSWGTLMEWLSHFDASKPYYIGTETQIADVIFAHGGSGFVVSRPAMQLVNDDYNTRSVLLNEYTDGHWAGDCVLGKVLADNGVNLHYSWPILQNSNVGELDEFTTGFYREPWCFPAAAFHHVGASDIQDLAQFEMHRWRLSQKSTLLHKDVFQELIYPELSNVRDNWDNLSEDEQLVVASFHECKSICTNDPDCVQFVYRAEKCFTGKTPRLGVRNSEARAGWIVRRVEHMVDKASSCSKTQWGV
ncbi:glycosyltransferase family 31 protein [Aspergillus affinis]|uniref:glycosyltransferase family 31 protein n=1 Tax=Aspergillus affinis TaxID=1070780 RepID=UPI0022FDF11B|nr:uncharacterized protein KD926_000865 [Aspergillus affinis]KAI9037079.1 hypothetical protein KD926_000865 [Aspergillus affinis]